MLTKELIGRIAEATGQSENLMAGKAIQLQGLGAFEIKERKARVIVHPRTGERAVAPSKNQVVFRPVGNLKDELKNI